MVSIKTISTAKYHSTTPYGLSYSSLKKLILGPKLGEGEFSNVYEVTSFKLQLTTMKHGLDPDISITLDDNGENFIVDTTTATNDEKKTESFEKDNNTEKEVSNSSNAIKDLSPEEYDKRHHMKEHELYRDTKNARYAIKHIKESYCKEHDSKSYIQAAR